MGHHEPPKPGRWALALGLFGLAISAALALWPSGQDVAVPRLTPPTPVVVRAPGVATAAAKPAPATLQDARNTPSAQPADVPVAGEIGSVGNAPLPSYGFCPDPNAPPPAFRRPGLPRDLVAIWHRGFGPYHDAVERAHDLRPSDPAIALACAMVRSQRGDPKGAANALATYVRAYPHDIAMAQLLRRLGLQAEIQAGYRTIADDGIVLAWAPSLGRERAEWALQRVQRSLEEAADLLGLPQREQLAVVIYDGRSELLAATCVPAWSGGVFDGTLRLAAPLLRDPIVGEQIIRHETLHAQLAAVPKIPLWFNEGVAQFFAGERSAAHERTFDLMVGNHTYIPFASLEGTFTVFSDTADARLAYHQSLAIIAWAVARVGEESIRDAVSYLRGDHRAPSLQAALFGEPIPSEEDLLEFLAN